MSLCVFFESITRWQLRWSICRLAVQMAQPCAVLRECCFYSKHCCQMVAVSGGAALLLPAMRSCNRSAPHVAFLHSALGVLNALARLPTTAGALLAGDGCMAALSELLQLFREKQVQCSLPMASSALHWQST